MTDRPQIQPAQLHMLWLLRQPRPGQLESAMEPSAVRRCEVHDVDGSTYRAQPSYRSVAELVRGDAAAQIKGAGATQQLSDSTVRDQLRSLIDMGAVEVAAVSCRCADEVDWAADRKVGISREPSRRQSQRYYRLTDVGLGLVDAQQERHSFRPEAPSL